MRHVTLPDTLPGHLYLHSMPGRHERWDDIRAEIVQKRIDCVVCLTPKDEIRSKSPDYATAIERGLPWEHVAHPIADYGEPGDPDAFRMLARDIARRLQDGESVLIHCGAGIGRTGTMAVAVLVSLGQPLAHAQRNVAVAGSSPETPGQRDLLKLMARGSTR
jgi:protein-tyrosine phosphatase